MDVTEFWSLIEAARAATADPDADQGKAIAAVLAERLGATSALTIFEYEQCFEQLQGKLERWDVWAAAHLINRDCSDDSFMDFRAGVIAQGRAWYERVVKDPDTLADHPDVLAVAAGGPGSALFAEPVNSIGAQAYERVDEVEDGSDGAFYEAFEAFIGPNEHEPADLGEQFDFDDAAQMRARLPRLAGMFLDRG